MDGHNFWKRYLQHADPNAGVAIAIIVGIVAAGEIVWSCCKRIKKRFRR